MEASTEPATRTHVRISPRSGWLLPSFREIWQYRELVAFMALRDIRLRYKQTALGVAWAVIQPLMTMVVFSIFLGRLAGIKTDGGIPYPLFCLVGLLPWQLFAYSLNQASLSMVAEQNLITKVYFPRLIIPLAAILAGLADFTIAFALTLVFMLVFAGNFTVTWAVVLVPVFVMLAVVTAFSVGLWLASLNIKYRDIRYTLPFLTQIWMFISPVGYPSSLVPAEWQFVYGLNPLVGVVEGFRWSLLGAPAPSAVLMLASLGMVAVLLVTGLMYFRKLERTFADVI